MVAAPAPERAQKAAFGKRPNADVFRRGPCWTLPLECVRGLADTNGVVEMTRLQLRHVLFQPHAVVELGPHGFVADVAYDDPKYPGRRQHATVRLAPLPQENAL